MKRPIAGSLIASLLLALPLLAQGGGTLRVGTSGDYPPFSRAGEGFDVAVARLLASELGLRLVFVPFRWPELHAAVEAGVFDVAMSGVTWRPERAAVGWMTRAVAAGGPCIVGQADGGRIGVNRGGILERFARSRFGGSRIRTVDDNLSLPGLLDGGDIDAFVTDSFEVAHFRRGGQPVLCEPATDRKVYWVSPRRASRLGPQIEAWLARSEAEIDLLRRQYLGSSAPRDGIDHLVDLLDRRLAYMPLVAAWKRQRGMPVEDLARESRVLSSAAAAAQAAGLEPASLERFFRLQMELAKTVQRRSPTGPPTLDLIDEIRPRLKRLGDRIVVELGVQVPLAASSLPRDRLRLLESRLEPAEITALHSALLALRRANHPPKATNWEFPTLGLRGQEGVDGIICSYLCGHVQERVTGASDDRAPAVSRDDGDTAAAAGRDPLRGLGLPASRVHGSGGRGGYVCHRHRSSAGRKPLPVRAAAR